MKKDGVQRSFDSLDTVFSYEKRRLLNLLIEDTPRLCGKPKFTNKSPEFTNKVPNFTNKSPEFTNKVPKLTNKVPNFTNKVTKITK
ncbi:hypothetical protein [Peribacillus muralis]|uniref:hypothetical protein n=1 Tax=Peribacillus muralis TaxID=264697 RepID=UPI00367125D1